jgi:hypothetical protein
MMVCWLSMLPLMFMIGSATANNNLGLVVWGARIAQAVLLGGIILLVLTVAFYALGSWRGDDENA